MQKRNCRAAATNTQRRADEARRWVTTQAGQQAIVTGLKQAETLTTQFKEAQRVDPESLHKPITL